MAPRKLEKSDDGDPIPVVAAEPLAVKTQEPLATVIIEKKTWGLSDSHIKQIIGLVGTVLIAWITYNQQRMANNQEKAANKTEEVAAKTEEVRTTLEKNNTSNDRKLDEMHRNTSFMLHVSSIVLRRVADLTQEAEDIKTAEIAEEAFREYEKQQSLLAPPKTR